MLLEQKVFLKMDQMFCFVNRKGCRVVGLHVSVLNVCSSFSLYVCITSFFLFYIIYYLIVCVSWLLCTIRPRQIPCMCKPTVHAINLLLILLLMKPDRQNKIFQLQLLVTTISLQLSSSIQIKICIKTLSVELQQLVELFQSFFKKKSQIFDVSSF